jgi:hypothetical protein
MAFTTPGTAVAGEVLTAAFWNEQVRDNMTAVAGPPFARNILYNGAMQIAQRNTSVASITTGTYYTADRWLIGLAGLGTWTQSVENDAPTGSGFRKSLKMLCTTADASPGSGDFLAFQQQLEGFDLQRIAKGTSSAQQLTMSFWVKSNVTGTYIAELADADNSRKLGQSYTLSASGTWEKKELVFLADTTGAFDNDNAASLTVNWWLGAGSGFTSGTLGTTWASTLSANRAVGQTNLAAATSNYWQITGVQLETGPIATPFEFLPFGDELRRCQRYYEKSYNYATVPGTSTFTGAVAFTTSGAFTTHANGPIIFAVTKRDDPVMSFWSNDGTANNLNIVGVGNRAITGVSYTAGMHGFPGVAWSAGQSSAAGAIGHWVASAEL